VIRFFNELTKEEQFFLGHPVENRIFFMMTLCDDDSINETTSLMTFFKFIFLQQKGRQYYLGLGPAVVEVL